jgi:hypothetical protein
MTAADVSPQVSKKVARAPVRDPVPQCRPAPQVPADPPARLQSGSPYRLQALPHPCVHLELAIRGWFCDVSGNRFPAAGSVSPTD